MIAAVPGIPSMGCGTSSATAATAATAASASPPLPPGRECQPAPAATPVPPQQATCAPADSCEDGPECPICLGALEKASTFALPECGHIFHALCIVSALQVQLYCPLCRCEVREHVCVEIASRLTADQARDGNHLLASELLLDLRAKGRTLDSGPSAAAVLEALRTNTKQGDTSKIASIAALLGRSTAATPQPAEIRLAAVEALRALVPTFPRTWPGLDHVLELLRGVCLYDENEEVRCTALQALKEVTHRGDMASLQTMHAVLRSGDASSDVRFRAADALQALAERGDVHGLRAALAALDDADEGVREAGLAALRQICQPCGRHAAILPDLGATARGHASAEIRSACMTLIVQACMEREAAHDGIALLTECLQDDDVAVVLAAAAALQRLLPRGSPEAVSLFVAASIGQFGREGGRGARAPEFRAKALETLAQMALRGDAAAVSAAAAILGKGLEVSYDGDVGDITVPMAAAQALKKLSVRGEHGEVVSILLGYVEGHADLEVKRQAIEVLGWMATKEDDRALKVLRYLRGGEDVDLQLAASQALRQMLGADA